MIKLSFTKFCQFRQPEYDVLCSARASFRKLKFYHMQPTVNSILEHYAFRFLSPQHTLFSKQSTPVTKVFKGEKCSKTLGAEADLNKK